MASAKQQENMLLTEHFSWPPISLIDDIINAINEVLYRCTDSFETGLSSADPALLGFSDLYASQNRTPDKDEDGNPVFPEARLEIEEGVLKLETLMENAVDKNFDKLEIWTLRNVFALGRGKGPGDEGLGDWVRLGHYENIQTPSKDAHLLTPEALYTLRRKLIETQKLNAALVAEKTRNEAQISRLHALLQPPSSSTAPKRETRKSTSPSDQTAEGGGEGGGGRTAASFAFLTHTPAAQALGIQPQQAQQQSSSKPTTTTITTTTITTAAAAAAAAASNGEKCLPLTTHTTFTTTQLPYLRQLLDSLKPHLAATTTTAAAALPPNTSSSPLPSTSHASAQRDSTKQRRIYVESQSKRILERRGVDVMDGVEGVWEGSRVRGDEVRGLEGLVAAMGKAGADSNMMVDRDEHGEDAMDTS